MTSQIEYEYVNMLVKEARTYLISETLLHQYAQFYLNEKSLEYSEAYRTAMEDLKKERGIWNNLNVERKRNGHKIKKQKMLGKC